MATILPFLKGGTFLRDGLFEPHDIKAMSMALDDVCKVMKLPDDSPAKEIIAARIIELGTRWRAQPYASPGPKCFMRRAWLNTRALQCARRKRPPRQASATESQKRAGKSETIGA